jgi:hypothetical protein
MRAPIAWCHHRRVERARRRVGGRLCRAGVAIGLIGPQRRAPGATTAACRAAGAVVDSAASMSLMGRRSCLARSFRQRTSCGAADRHCRYLGRPDPTALATLALTERQLATNLTAPSTRSRRSSASVRRGADASSRSPRWRLSRSAYSPGYCASKAGLRAYAEALWPASCATVSG